MKLNLLVRTMDECDGYGRMGWRLYEALQDAGVNVRLIRETDLQRRAPTGLTLTVAYGAWVNPLPCPQWVFTMWEDSQLPFSWLPILNQRAERVLVPCPHNQAVFTRSGVTVPVDVVPMGVDPCEFPLLPHSPHKPYTFLTWGDRGSRKGWETTWAAFHHAFKDTQDVRLIIKTRAGGDLDGALFKDKRLSIWDEDVPDINDVFQAVDCVVFPAKGEGWGLPPREAAATGLPVIATRHSGLEVGIDHWAYPLERNQVQRSQMHLGKNVPENQHGNWVIPDYVEVAEKMRYCYENPQAALDFGRSASAWLHTNQTWAHSAQVIIRLMEANGYGA